MKALPIEVYKSHYGDCSNGGITSRYWDLLLVCDEGYIEIDENDPPENLVVVKVRHFGGKEYKYIEPVAHCDSGCVGWMNGGALAYSCDSRFRNISPYPLCIHDRQESQKLYNSMFD